MRDDDVAAGVGRIKDVTIFTALGIDTKAHKSILGFWVNEGDENKALWADVFIPGHGNKRVLIFVTDDFPGVKEIIKKLYPFAIINYALFTCKETSGSTFQRKYIRR
jgi:transposase-like protein